MPLSAACSDLVMRVELAKCPVQAAPASVNQPANDIHSIGHILSASPRSPLAAEWPLTK